MKIKISPFAEMDIMESVSYYDERKPRLGNDFLEEVNSTFTYITRNSKIFPFETRHFQKAIIKRFPFTVIFLVEEQISYIIAVFHNRRNPEELVERYDFFP